MKSQLVALFIFAFLLVAMVKETDCYRSTNGKKYEDSEGKRSKVTNTGQSVFSFAFVLCLCLKHIDPAPLSVSGWLSH